jgi:hypothetical protein
MDVVTGKGIKPFQWKKEKEKSTGISLVNVIIIVAYVGFMLRVRSWNVDVLGEYRMQLVFSAIAMLLSIYS